MASQSKSVRQQIERHVLPSDFLTACLATTRDEFLAEYGDTWLLLIQLDEVDDELATGLLAASTVGGERLKPTRDAIGFSTIVQETTHRTKLSDPPPAGRFDAIQLETRVVRRPHFIAPLRRRPAAGRAFTEHISVGRAHNSDIVLRHASVSKFHAWFECDEAGQFYVGDAKSKNGTKVNSARISGDLTLLAAGDDIRFGKVVTTVVTAELFWDAIVGARRTLSG